MTDIITDYFKKVERDSELIESIEEEYALLEKAQAGDQEAINEMVQSNLRLVIHIAKRYAHVPGVTFEDLIQEGNLGLYRAIEKFNLESGHKFSTYATWWIRQNITRYISNNSRTVRIPIKMSETISKAKRLRESLHIKLGRDPTNQELADALGITLQRYKDVLRASQNNLSMDQPGLRDSEQPITLGEMLESDDPNVEETFVRNELQNSLADAMSILTEEERYIILAVNGFLTDRYYPKKDIAKDLGYKSTSTITKKERDAEAKMREFLIRQGGEGISDFMRTYD